MTQLSARLSANGERIIMSGDIGSPEAQEFFHSLPSCRMVRGQYVGQSVVSCMATPIAAWRIFGNAMFEDRCSEDISTAGNEVAETFFLNGNSYGLTEQPEFHRTTGWRHQLEAYWFSRDWEATLLALEMGCGKSKVAVDLVNNWDCDDVLILCPKSVVGVWRREFNVHSFRPYDVHVCEKGTVKKKAEDADAHLHMSRIANRAIVINYESAWRPDFARFALSRNWDCVILDESHRVKAHNSKQSKFVAKLGQRARRRLCLTGTPMPHSPLDLFGQFRFLDPGVFGDSWFHFRNRYALMANPHIPQQVTGYRNQDELKERMAWISYRVGAEVLDLPEEQHHVRTFALCPKAMRHYKEIEEDMITQVADGVCSVANVLVKSIRLRQATSGFIVEDETKTIHRIDDGRQKLLEELLEDMGPGEPVVVFAEFVQDLAHIAEATAKLGRRYGEISGRHKDLTPDATMPDNIDVMGVQLQSGGTGIDLTRARYAVYYSQTYRLGDYLQSLKRVHRPGQTRPVSYYHLVAERTVDVAVREALSKKQEVVDVVLEIFRRGK